MHVMASTPIVAEPHHAVRFKEWLASHGGSFHPRVRYSPGECDLSRLGGVSLELTLVLILLHTGTTRR